MKMNTTVTNNVISLINSRPYMLKCLCEVVTYGYFLHIAPNGIILACTDTACYTIINTKSNATLNVDTQEFDLIVGEWKVTNMK